LFSVPELDFSEDLFAESLVGPWLRLGAWPSKPHSDPRGVEDVGSRRSLLLPRGQFREVFDHLESIGNVIDSLGKPGGLLCSGGADREYRYAPFHQFTFPFSAVTGEPLVFVHPSTSGDKLLINPDLWLFLELEERTSGCGIWWDPRRGVDALVQRVLDESALETVDIRVGHLLRYLQARQMSLIVGHYRQLLLLDPPQSAIAAFVKEDVTLGSPEQGAKAVVQNWGLGRDLGRTACLQRRLHLWFEIRPPDIDVGDPWADQPSFDPYTFTLPTRIGAAAPARWAHLRRIEERTFEGEVCDFMERIYFRQEVLAKYEGASGFDVKDDGSVSCRYYWGLTRSTARIGNELLSTAIGDFAEGVPFEEWQHWKQYAMEPPSQEAVEALVQEPTVPAAVNSLAEALQRLNAASAEMAAVLGLAMANPPWGGSLNSLAGRQLKWIYPATADDDEFLKRATLASTLVVEGLTPASLRDLLISVGGGLHQSFEKPPRSLGSRNLLQRASLIALLLRSLHPALTDLAVLVKQAKVSPQAPSLICNLNCRGHINKFEASSRRWPFCMICAHTEGSLTCPTSRKLKLQRRSLAFLAEAGIALITCAFSSSSPRVSTRSASTLRGPRRCYVT